MRKWNGLVSAGIVVLMSCVASAQPPGRPGQGGGPAVDDSSFIKRMMTFDANQDGTLSKQEVTDARLLSLFDRADDDHDGAVSRQELTALFAKESVDGRGGPDGGFPGQPGFGGRGGPGGPGGPGGGMGGPPPIGEVFPPPVRDALRLSNAQRKKMDALQKMVDARIEQILTDEQRQQFEEMRSRGRGAPDGERRRFGPPPDGPEGRRREPPGEGGRPRRPPE